MNFTIIKLDQLDQFMRNDSYSPVECDKSFSCRVIDYILQSIPLPQIMVMRKGSTESIVASGLNNAIVSAITIHLLNNDPGGLYIDIKKGVVCDSDNGSKYCIPTNYMFNSLALYRLQRKNEYTDDEIYELDKINRKFIGYNLSVCNIKPDAYDILKELYDYGGTLQQKFNTYLY